MKNGEEKAARKSAERKGSGGNDRVATKTRGKGKKAAKIAAVTFAVLFAACGIVMLGGFLWFRSWAEGVELDPSLLPTATAIPVVLDRNGNDMGYATDDYVAPGSLPEHVGAAFVALEDRRFYSHHGYDPRGILRAVFNNIRAGRTVEGGSTITQQLVKNTHLSSERTLSRKLKEIALAMKIEKEFSKDEILSMYLSVIYFGAGAYGIGDASRVYFGKTPEELTVAEAATLAGILKNPSAYSPKNDIEKARERRDHVLDVMCREGYIDENERDAAKGEKLVLAGDESADDPARCYVAEAIKEACNMLGITEYMLGNSGLVISTAYDPEAQEVLVRENSDRANYSADDVAGAAALVDNATGEVLAYHSTLGYKIARQGGSALKPLVVYAPALETGAVTLATPLRDERTDFGGYSPENFGGVYYGDTTPREALKRSMNTAAVKVMTYIGAERAVKCGSALGLPLTQNDENLALALGATEKGLDPVTLAGAYATFAREGNFVRPHFVKSISEDGRKVCSADITARKVFSRETSALVTDCLKDTVRDGTARSLSVLPFDIAGKTGTVQKSDSANSDAWSVSYTTRHTLAVWHGGDDMTELGGGHPTKQAAKIWKALCEGDPPPAFLLPRGVRRENVDVYSTFRNKKVTLAVADTPMKYVKSELFASSFRPTEDGSAFIAPLPRFTAETSDGVVTLNVQTEPAFDIKLTCTDALGTRTVGTISGETGAFVREKGMDTRPPRVGDGIFGIPLASGTEKGEDIFRTRTVTVTHTPFSMGGMVTYTLTLVLPESGKEMGSASAVCFP